MIWYVWKILALDASIVKRSVPKALRYWLFCHCLCTKPWPTFQKNCSHPNVLDAWFFFVFMHRSWIFFVFILENMFVDSQLKPWRSVFGKVWLPTTLPWILSVYFKFSEFKRHFTSWKIIRLTVHQCFFTGGKQDIFFTCGYCVGIWIWVTQEMLSWKICNSRRRPWMHYGCLSQ